MIRKDQSVHSKYINIVHMIYIHVYIYAIQGIFINVLLFIVIRNVFFVLHCMKHIHVFFLNLLFIYIVWYLLSIDENLWGIDEYL